MRHLGKMALIGSGPSTIYLLKHLVDHLPSFRGKIDSITIFEKSAHVGYGMPYNPETTDRYNRSNISSDELPELPQSFCNWLKKKDEKQLSEWGIEKSEINAQEVYYRLALGEYFHAQFVQLTDQIRHSGLSVVVRLSSPVRDVDTSDQKIRVHFSQDENENFDTIVIASGHSWEELDRPGEGYFSSPWPIFKLLPKEGQLFDFPIDTLGASLSAFDVISALSHRHGEFMTKSGRLIFEAKPGAENFKLVMHSSEGWLPHLLWDQENPIRKIYRHVSRKDFLAQRDEDGFLRLDTFFDKICRPVFIDAFVKDGMNEMASLLEKKNFTFSDFVEEMTERHEYHDSFEGMAHEWQEAHESVEKHRPIHWKETLDDLMYCLNYHAELLPAEDHLVFKKTVMPFLMNVIAAMPLQSAAMLLALHEAGIVSLVAGRVTVDGPRNTTGTTTITIENDGKKSHHEYQMFVDCSGQKALGAGDYPFQSLVKNGLVREAAAPFSNPAEADTITPEKLTTRDGEKLLRLGGIDIDPACRVIGRDGKPNPQIHDISFPHCTGIRPYSYGLQACSTTTEIVVNSWLADGHPIISPDI